MIANFKRKHVFCQEGFPDVDNTEQIGYAGISSILRHMNFIKNKYFILGNIILLLIVIPITLYAVKRQTSLTSKAAPTTVLSFTPAVTTTNVGDSIALDVFVDPGQNVISILDQLTVEVDPTILEIVSLEKNDAVFPVALRPAVINTDGTASISMSTSNDIQQAIQVKTKVATLTVKAKAATNGTPTLVKINKPPTQAFSLATTDGQTENVLSSTIPASIDITDTLGASPSPSLTVTPGAGSTSTGSAATNQKPVCSALSLDRSESGTAPYSLVFTATGTDADGTLSKVAFNFGDGPVQEVTTAGGLGTNSANVQISHTYTSPGSYSATAVFTDSKGDISDTVTCSKTITVADASANAGGGTGGTGGTGTAEPTPTLPVTGTLETTLAVLGIAGATIVVGLFFFIL